MKRLTWLLGIALSLSLFADHTGKPGSVGNLAGETDRLDRAVQYSSLNYNVKYAVSRFSQDVDRLHDCVDHSEINRDHTGTTNPGCPSQCSYYLNYARSSFQDVERYLYDTNFDYPQVYQAYRSAKYALEQIYVLGPTPTTQNYKCVAFDMGWEEHAGGHAAYGKNYNDAQRSALYQCQRYHPSCRVVRCDPA